MDPKHQALSIAYGIMRKNRMKKMGKGGNEKLDPMHEPEMEDEEPMSKGGMAFHPMKMAQHIMMKKMAKGGMADCYADGGEVEGDMDDSMGFDEMNGDPESESLPEDDMDAVGIPELGYDSSREDVEGMGKRRGMLSKIMRNLRSSHYGK